MSDQLNAVRMVWKDLVDADMRRYFEKYTYADLEVKTRAMLRERLLVYGGIARELRKQIPDPELLRRCLLALQECAAQDKCEETAMHAYALGGKEGHNGGEPSAKNMIKETRLFGKRTTRANAPWLYDAEDDDDDKPTDEPI